MTIIINGLDELRRKLNKKTLLAKPLGMFFKRTSQLGASEAERDAPKDLGRLSGAIKNDVDRSAIPMWAKWGVLDHPYGTKIGLSAFAQEYGTGLLAEGENAKGGRHFPPPAALEGWARRHGIPNGFLVARAIWRRGGLRPRRFMRKSQSTVESKLPGEIKKTEKEIEKIFNS